MRTPCTAALVILAVVALGGTAAASVASSGGPPVKLKGTVTNKGIGTVKGTKTEIEADDFYFKKTFLKAKAGSKVSVTVKNEGKATHTFTIDAQRINKTIQPGKSVTVTVKVPSGTKVANFYCRFHVGSGMQGAFFSAAGAKTSATSTRSSSGGYGY